ncbi:hypothetical protein SAMN02910447_03060 [Ruminococcus sp. YE71]|uniref:hypothetical protein n=1 Tax=unclassified Ruminococcus TaxID=2608920 RepID=UPI0008916E71|nr:MULTISPECIES: hypothetical protein [unclassified Ruminococcus]SDA29496.1 hypothetical protein SAMN02910446_03132 [Ruminococcus sp. YE78]SFW48378.1 hypothetical protein SAMN02910447_03060 [Ruminococcus sp. YE71]
MKKRLRKYKVNNAKKRVISSAIVFALLMSDFPMPEFSELIEKKTSSAFSLEASAEIVYDRSEYTKHYINEGVDTGYILIESWDDLVWYSQSYHNYSLGTVYSTDIEHEKDILFLNFGESQGNNYNLNGKNYVPIGNDNKPFEGRIIFSNSSATETFNVPESLFGTISEKVSIKNQTETAVKQIKLTRTGTGSGDVLFARKVKSDDDSTTCAEWNIIFDKFDNSSAISYAGLIGEIEAGANVQITYENNSILTKSNLEANATSSDTDGKPVDAGALCGKMGAGASLTATYSGTNTDYNITSANGNAGGLVGSMEVGSSLTVTTSNLQGASAWVSASNGYAGGIVGKNDGGTVTITPSSGTTYTVSQIIHGKYGSGGLFGYYAPPSAATSELDISNYLVNCKLEQAVSETGFSGGIIGVIENAPADPTGRVGGSLTIKGKSDGTTAVTSTHVSQLNPVTGKETGYKAEAYGGLIGSYKADDTGYSLNIKDVSTTPTNTLSASVYGGGIGKIIDASYVKFETFKLNSAAGDRSGIFGGLVADCPNGYIYTDGSTTNENCTGIVIGSSVIDGFTGGGLVGNLGDGVLGMKGTINVSNAKPSAADTNGHLVGTRDNAFIYSDGTLSGYSMSEIEVDNVGSWGDVLVIDGTKLKKDTTDDALNVFSESNHMISIVDVTTTAIANAADYAKASLLYQIDVTENDFIANTSSLTSSSSAPLNLTFGADIDLTGTGLRGITRDNGTDRVSYSGTISGGHTITLDIKNVGGSNRPVYRKKYIGMLGIADTVTINNTTFSGTILSKNERTTDKDTICYLGSAAAQIKTSFIASNCNTASGLSITMTGSKDVISGRLIGEAESAIGTITISGSTYDGNITGNNKTTVGGTIGKIAGAASGAVWSFNGITLRGNVKGIQHVGGLISDVEGSGNATIKLGNSSSVVADNNLHIEGNSSDSMGGLLGYSWSKADVEVTDVVVSGHPTVEQKSSGGAAGLVYSATGHWTITKLYLGYTDAEENSHAIKMLTGTAGSVGMIVNKGKISSDGIYLELPSGYDYKLAYYTAETEGSAFKSGGVFDEICAYSASSKDAIMNNGQGIVSISTTGLTMSTTASDSLSYKNQTVQGKYKNGNTRYYYNLDTIDKDNTLSSTAYAKKLMRWGVRQYACGNIQKYFPDPFSNNTIPSGTYNMQGYSWYPVTPLNAMTVNGTFTFYNKEFDDCEKVKGKHANISDANNKNIWSPLEADQHYMMQNGLFYDVNKNITIDAITIAGTIGAVDSTSGTGALVYGTVKGTSTAVTTISNTGTISLAGIRVWNLSTYSSYAPLLINKASDYVTFDIKNVSTTADYKRTTTGETPVTTTIDAATSLIGKAGTRDTVTTDSSGNQIPISQGITVNFSAIKLDGRNAEYVSAYGTTPDRYNTTKSIFTSATLLEQLIGSNGIYNYTFDEDWGTGTPHKVTYGKEVGYTTQGQYPNQELWYKDEKATGGKSRYTHPDAAPLDSGSTQYTGFDSFRPYVASVSTKADIDDKTGFKYQLMVNHQPSDEIAGCGTYNDPYIITSATDLVNISKFINSASNLNGKINIDVDGDGWCDSTTVDQTTTLYTEHVKYTLNTTSDATCTGQPSITAENMRKYLASAYYQIRLSGANQLVLTSSSGFVGLGTSDIPFSGVIDGGQNSTTTIVNETQYPLINYSGGCVVRNLIVTVNETVTLDDATDSYDYITGGKTHGAYGAIIAVVEGGDNIIDNTQVTFGTSVKINAMGKKAQFQPIGGYVGVVVNGGVIFRNMTTGNISGITSSNVSAVKGGDWPQINYSDGNPINTSAKLSEYTVNMTQSNNLLWLYVNPIIGRVINGYAVNIASEYHTAYSDCIMNNGNKSYSITDISLSGGSLTISGSNLTVPNGQALFLTSVIVNSGMGATKLGYTSDYIKRTAAYDKVGSNAAAPSSCPDYDTYARNDTTSGPAYIIKNFAAGGNTLGSGGPWNITLTSNGSFVLPDGFRGIGNFYQNDTDLLLNVSDFNGNGVTITENILFYTYDDGSGNFDNTYYPNTNVEGAGSFCSTTDAGIGLFTKQPQVGGNYYNFKLSGKIKSDVINHKTGVHIDYTGNTSTDKVGGGNVDQKQVLSAGMLFGNFSGAGAKKVRNATPTHITNVALVNVDVSAAKMAGGMIGIVPIGADNNDGFINMEIEIISSEYNSSGIKVHGGLSAAGLIARYQQGTCNINFNGNSFGIIEIVSDTKSNTDSYYYGVGGIIGTLRADRETPATPVTIKNVTLGDENATKAIEVKCSESGCGINAGGLIGSLNRASATMDNCHVFNVSVSSNGSSTHVGGAFGHMRTQCNVTVKDSSIESNDTAKASISGNGYVGGFLGNSPNNKDKARIFTVEKSRIKGYTISGDTSGGIVGERDAIDATYYLKVSDFSIENCIIKGDTYAGGLIGHLIKPLNGYNILAKDLTFEPHTEGGTITNLGYLVAKNDSVVKLVGFSRQAEDPNDMVHAMTGGSSATNYGSGGYVIFADYMGTASYDNDDFTPEANSKDAFSGMTSNTNVTPYAPYVSTSPFINIANYNYVMQYLLSDGASPLTSATFGRSTQAFAKIYDDIANNNNGYYEIPKAYLDTEDEYKSYTTKISSFKTEMGDKLANGIDFPVLVLDKINKDEMTDFINHYINLLTNTSSTYNFATSANSTIYDVDIYKVIFNAAGDEISTITDVDTCLKVNAGTNATAQFYIESDDTDTAASTAQFTLMDVKFMNPSATGTVAYHLYIPCYVRKLLEYDFDIHIDSGTTYDINKYTQLTENSLVENIGTPITLEFAFTYLRSAAEWTEAVNSGDSLLTNYPKNLLFDNSTNVSSGSKPQFPATTQMVLIDTQNSSKAYYLDGLDNTSFNPFGDYRTLNFSSFADLDSTEFSPVNFNDMLNVSVTGNSSGTLVQDNTNAIVQDTTTKTKYRMATDAEKNNSNIQKYSATVTFKNPDDIALSEHYFLTIYTPYSTADVVYHYVIQANKDLGTDPYPSRITTVSEGNAVHLYTGYIYNNHVYIDSLKVGGIENNVEITAENNSIEASIHATIGLTSSGEENIRSTLSATSPPDIFQSFLIKLNKDGNVGLAAASSVTVEDYMIGNKPVTHSTLNPSWTSSEYTDIRIPNYIEMRNGVLLARSLSEIPANGTLNVSAKATITFDNDNGDITAQFFPQTAKKYTTLIAYSNIASSSENTASSNVSASADTTVGGVKPQYYTKIEEKAILNYDALDILADGSYLPQLGINANDPKDFKKLPAPIKTVASYNVENCQSAWQEANFIKIEIELKSKNDDYNTPLDIFDYIQESTFSIFDDEIAPGDIITTGTTSTKLVYIINKADLEHFYNDKVYRIPIDFNVYSGSGSSNNFESSNRQYSNYGIFLKVSMLQAANSASAVSGTEPEYNNNNYVKYTNARIYLEKLNPNKSAA